MQYEEAKIIEVSTGKVEVAKTNDILRSSAIGSCICILAYQLTNKIGGLAHIMLPGYAPAQKLHDKTKYAGNAIDEMLEKMFSLGANIKDIEVCIAGGSNVLKKPEDTIAKHNLDSVVEILRDKGIKIKAEAVGGTTRRSVSFDIEKGSIFCTEGNESERLLWTAEERGMRLWIKELEETKSAFNKVIERLRTSEEEVRKERNFSKNLVDTAQIIILVLDISGSIITFNPYMEELSGYKIEEVKGKDWFTTFLPECDYGRTRSLFKKAVTDMQTKGNKNYIICKNGQSKLIEWYDKTLKDKEGHIVGLLSVGMDITDKKKDHRANKKK